LNLIKTLFAYHRRYSTIADEEFYQLLMQLVDKFFPDRGEDLWVQYDPTEPVKYVAETSDLMRILYNSLFVPNLRLFFSVVNEHEYDPLIIPESFGALTLKYFRQSPAMYYELFGGDRMQLICDCKFTPNVELPSLSGELEGFLKTTPGYCLKKVFVLMQYLKVHPNGQLWLHATTNAIPHIEVNNVPGGSLRLSWSNRKNRMRCDIGNRYPETWLTIDCHSIRTWGFYYQPYQHILEANARDVSAAILLCLKEKNYAVEVEEKEQKNMSKHAVGRLRLIRLQNCSNKDWQICQHMYSAYQQHKRVLYPRLHRYDWCRPKEEEFFKRADQYLSKMLRDYVIYTDAPLMELKEVERVVVEKKKRIQVRYEKVEQFYDETPEVAEAAKNIIKRKLSPIAIKTLYHYRWMSRLREAVEKGEPCYSSLDERAALSLRLAWEELITAHPKGDPMLDNMLWWLKDVGLTLKREEIDRKERQILSQAVGVKKLTATQFDKIIKKTRDFFFPDEPWQYDGLSRGRFERIQETVEMDEPSVVKEIKMVTTNVVPLGTSLYRRIDLKKAADLQLDDLKKRGKKGPLIRRKMEVYNHLKKICCLGDEGPHKRALRLYQDRWIHMSNEEYREDPERLNLIGKTNYVVGDLVTRNEMKMRRKWGENWKEKALEVYALERKEKELVQLTKPKRIKVVGIDWDQKISTKQGKTFREGKGFFGVIKGKKTVNQPVRDFGMIYNEALRNNPDDTPDFVVPAYMLESYYQFKTASVLSRLSWVTNYTPVVKRTRKNVKNKLVYNMLYLKL